jgi:ADP-ribose pyrophosphatase YjhB (NUDIX family)
MSWKKSTIKPSDAASAAAVVFTSDKEIIKVLVLFPRWSQNFNLIFHDLQKRDLECKNYHTRVQWLGRLTFDEVNLIQSSKNFKELFWNKNIPESWVIDSIDTWGIDINTRIENAEIRFENFKESLKKIKIFLAAPHCTFIKGTLEKNETSLHCIIREIQEESGLDLAESPNKVFYINTSKVTSKVIMTQYFFFSEKEETLKVKSNEVLKAEWKTIEDCIEVMKELDEKHTSKMMLSEFILWIEFMKKIKF